MSILLRYLPSQRGQSSILQVAAEKDLGPRDCLPYGSVQRCKKPSAFRTRTTGEAEGLALSSVTSFWRRLANWYLTLFHLKYFVNKWLHPVVLLSLTLPPYCWRRYNALGCLVNTTILIKLTGIIITPIDFGGQSHVWELSIADGGIHVDAVALKFILQTSLTVNRNVS